MATLNARPRPARSRYLMPGGVTDVPRADIGIDVAVPCDHLNVSPAAVASFDASHYEGFKINRPSGTITFLFTDVEGSSRLWDEHPDAMATALRQHDSILRAALEGHGGYIFTTAGDSFSAAFSNPVEAITAAREIQGGLQSAGDDVGEIKVRIGIHTGLAEERGGDYFGPALSDQQVGGGSGDLQKTNNPNRSSAATMPAIPPVKRAKSATNRASLAPTPKY